MIEVAEFILTECDFAPDPGVFEYNIEQTMKKVKALANMIEKILGLPKGTFVI